MRKNKRVYVSILLTWVILSAFVIVPFVQESMRAPTILLSILLGLNGLFILYFWLNGIKDIIYTLNYWFSRNKFDDKTREIDSTELDLSHAPPRVALVYTTCDDFIEESLLESMKQDYSNFYTVILDDSKTKEYKNIVKQFAIDHPSVKVIRRRSHKGFKAGNLNHYLLRHKSYDYFVILDSDEIIPHDFIIQSFKYFTYYDNIGIVQGNHISTRNANRFMSRFAVGVDSHWNTYQTVKQDSGFMSFLGHGAMISRKCFDAVGKFPETVAEDLCFSIEARYKGYFVAFARNIICQEQYPIDYMAFKKRHSKWTQGNMEFIKGYTKKIITGSMSWFEKLDIFLFTYNLPLTAILAFYIVINIVLFPVLGYSIRDYPAWLLIPTVVFLLAPMLNDIIYFSRIMKLRKILAYVVNVMILYGSMYFISLYSSAKTIFGGKAKFIVTPKDERHVGLYKSVIENYRELVFAAVLSAISICLCNSILPVVLIVVPSVLSPYLGTLADKRVLKGDAKSNGIETVVFAESDSQGKLDSSFIDLITRDLTNCTIVKVEPNKPIRYDGTYSEKIFIYVPTVRSDFINGRFYALSDNLPKWSDVAVVVPEYQKSPKWHHHHARKISRNLRKRLNNQGVSMSLDIVKFHV